MGQSERSHAFEAMSKQPVLIDADFEGTGLVVPKKIGGSKTMVT